MSRYECSNCGGMLHELHKCRPLGKDALRALVREELAKAIADLRAMLEPCTAPETRVQRSGRSAAEMQNDLRHDFADLADEAGMAEVAEELREEAGDDRRDPVTIDTLMSDRQQTKDERSNCACPRTDAHDCYAFRYAPMDDIQRADFFSIMSEDDDQCRCMCHDEDYEDRP
jgi:hypothetical protein